MGTEITTREQPSSALVTREYLTEQAALVRQLYAPEASDAEFSHFIEVCATRGLNPLARQIYCISRFDKRVGRKVATIQTSIDGFRLIAQRTAQYRGQVGPWWCGADGQWREVWLEKTPPAAARVGVVREGFAEPVYAIALWSAYADEKSSFWGPTKGVNQLAKCAEALAIRKAFPEELSGLYTSEEMGQADKPAAAPPLWRERWDELTGFGLPLDQLKAGLKENGITSAADLADDAKWALAVSFVNHADESVDGVIVPDDPPDAPTGDEAAADEAWEGSQQTLGATEHSDPTT